MSNSQKLLVTIPVLLAGFLGAQSVTLPPSGNNQKAIVTQFIGPVRVSIEYSSPSVHGPTNQDRRGAIWGKLVPYGLAPNNFGTAKQMPWRAGANENTVFATSQPVLIEGKPLPAGRYGFHAIPGQETWTLIFSKNSSSWGSFFYDQGEDVLRVEVRPKKHEYREWLTYEFTMRRPAEAVAELQWEDLAVAWNIKVENGNDIYISRLRDELRGQPGFTYQNYLSAVQFCLQARTGYEQALEWANAATAPPFGQMIFATMSAKAQVLDRLNRGAEAKTLMAQAMRLPATTPVQINNYGRALVNQGRKEEALEVYKLNAERFGEQWPVNLGLARGYGAMGDYPKALEHARKALAQAPDPGNKQNLEAMVKAFSEGKAFAN